MLDYDWCLRAEIYPAEEELVQQALVNSDPYLGWFDADKFTSECEIRGRRGGERFHPLGMREGTIKLADFFINVKIPRRARKGWPLIWVGDQIAWVPGYRVGHPFRITTDTTQVVKLHLYQAKT